MEQLMSIGLGLGLAAACGFRIFVPFLVMSVAANAGHLTLGVGFEWIGTTPALIALAVATLLEIVAYYVPWLDTFLDTAAAPVAVVAGILVTASAISGMSPMLHWGLAVIAGGGVAATVQAATTVTRQLSTWTTLGFGNPIVATAEAGGSLLMTALALLLPLAAVGVVLVGIVLLGAFVVKKWPERPRTSPVTT